MFATIGNNVNIPTSPTLVATALPNSNALRPPYDNVTPSVSSAKLDDNASGNRVLLLKNENTATSLPANIQAEKFAIVQSSNSTSFAADAQTAFLTQLASGDISPEVYGIFVQYDKLVSYANVKYKPSNAGKPVDPVTIFSTLIQLDKQGQDSAQYLIDNTQIPSPELTSEPVYIAELDSTPAKLIGGNYTQQQSPIEAEAMPQLNAYSATMVRNMETAPKELELA